MAKKNKTPAPVHIQQTVSEVFRTILKHNFTNLSQWEDAARSWDDIEGVHQLRVLFRRMRSALTTFRSAVPRPTTKVWSEEMRWLANQLGPARDLDVFIDEGLEAISGKLPLPGEEKIAVLTERHREIAYESVRFMLDSERYEHFKRDFAAWLDTQGWLNEEVSSKKRKRLESPIVPFARKLLDKQANRVLSAGEHADATSAAEMHQLRIECKKLRYGAEFFVPIFSGMTDFIEHMKGLQDLLGVMHDVAVMPHLLADLLAGEQDPDVLQYAGGLVGWRTRLYYDIKDTFDTRWEEFVQAKHPWWDISVAAQ